MFDCVDDAKLKLRIENTPLEGENRYGRPKKKNAVLLPCRLKIAGMGNFRPPGEHNAEAFVDAEDDWTLPAHWIDLMQNPIYSWNNSTVSEASESGDWSSSMHSIEVMSPPPSWFEDADSAEVETPTYEDVPGDIPNISLTASS